MKKFSSANFRIVANFSIIEITSDQEKFSRLQKILTVPKNVNKIKKKKTLISLNLYSKLPQLIVIIISRSVNCLVVLKSKPESLKYSR